MKRTEWWLKLKPPIRAWLIANDALPAEFILEITRASGLTESAAYCASEQQPTPGLHIDDDAVGGKETLADREIPDPAAPSSCATVGSREGGR